MKQSLKSFYTGDKGHDGTTLGWNAIMGLVLYLDSEYDQEIPHPQTADRHVAS